MISSLQFALSVETKGTNLIGQQDILWDQGMGIQVKSESHSIVSNSFWPHGLCSSWNSLGQNTGVGSLSLLQGIFPTQGSNPGLLHCRQILYQLSYQETIRGTQGSLSINKKVRGSELQNIFASSNSATKDVWRAPRNLGQSGHNNCFICLYSSPFLSSLTTDWLCQRGRFYVDIPVFYTLPFPQPGANSSVL